MNSHTQILRDNLPTTGTHLRGATRINEHNCPTSFFRFVRTVLRKLTPGGIRDAFVHTTPVAVLHILNVQLLKGKQLINVNQSAARLVSKVTAAIGNSLMDMLHHALALAISRCSLRLFAEASLGLGQCLLIAAEEARVLNLFAVGQCSKVCKSNIHSSYRIANRQRLRLNDTGEASIPVANGIPSDSQGLSDALQGPVQLDFHFTNLRKVEFAIFIETPVALLLWIGERIVVVKALKARVARLISGLHTPEESTEGEVNAHLGVLHRLGVTFLEPRFVLFPLRQKAASIISAKGFLLLLVGISAGLQRLVVDPTAAVQLPLQDGTLGRSWT